MATSRRSRLGSSSKGIPRIPSVPTLQTTTTATSTAKSSSIESFASACSFDSDVKDGRLPSLDDNAESFISRRKKHKPPTRKMYLESRTLLSSSTTLETKGSSCRVADLPRNSKVRNNTLERPWRGRSTPTRMRPHDKAACVIQQWWRRHQEDLIGFRIRKVLYRHRRTLGRRVTEFQTGYLHGLQVSYMENQRDMQALTEQVRSQASSWPAAVAAKKILRDDHEKDEQRNPEEHERELKDNKEGRMEEKAVLRKEKELQNIDEQTSSEGRVRKFLLEAAGANDSYFDAALRVEYATNYRLGPADVTPPGDEGALKEKMVRDFVIVARAKSSLPTSMKAILRYLQTHWVDVTVEQWDVLALDLYERNVIRISRNDVDRVSEVWFQ